MLFSTLIGNDRIKTLLTRAVAENRIGQGLIFAGPEGIGKRQFALALAAAVNCLAPVPGDACGVCLSCRKVTAREHPDIETISPDGQFIKIDSMRRLSREAQYRPFEGKCRVFLIDEADRLREQAANSILKTLEEPPPSTLLILITAKPYALLDTIRSRCQLLSFAPLTAAELEAYLKANFRRPVTETHLLARLARGSIGRAMEIDLGVYKEKRQRMLEILEALSLRPDPIRLAEAAEFISRKLERPDFEEHLKILLTVLEDIFHLQLGATQDSLTHTDIAPRLAEAASSLSLHEVSQLAEQFEQLLKDLAVNVNRQIALENLFVSHSL